MKLLKNEKTETHHEIEIEYSFLWIRWKEKYRKVGSNIYRFESPNNYYPIGPSEHMDVMNLFYATV